MLIFFYQVWNFLFFQLFLFRITFVKCWSSFFWTTYDYTGAVSWLLLEQQQVVWKHKELVCNIFVVKNRNRFGPRKNCQHYEQLEPVWKFWLFFWWLFMISWVFWIVVACWPQTKPSFYQLSFEFKVFWCL